jgi:hypothetical protein
MPIDVVEETKTKYDIKWPIFFVREVENVVFEELVSVRLDFIDLKHKIRLFHMHTSAVNPQDVVTPGQNGVQRPEPGVAAEVQESFSLEAASIPLNQGIKKMLFPLRMAIDVVFLKNRRYVTS